MQARFETVSPVEKKLIVEIPWTTVSEKLGVAYKELSKTVALKGFRKGHAPRPILEQFYGPRVQYDVAVDLVRESFFRATAEHKIAAVAEPRVQEGGTIKKGEAFTYAAIVEVRGEVVPKDYLGLSVEKRRIVIPQDKIEDAIQQLVRQHTELVPIEGRDVTEAGDVLALTFSGTIENEAVNQPHFNLELDGEIEPLPGLRAFFTGVPMNTKDKEYTATLPDDWREEPLRGKRVALKFSILDARKKEVPALDDDFAKDTGKGDTMAAVRAALKKELEDREGETVKREMREMALRELITKNQIPVASSLVDRAVVVQYNRLKQMFGIEDKNDRGPTPDLAEKMRPSAADEVRGQLLLEAIAEKEGLSVAEAEVEDRVTNVARMRGLPPARVRSEMQHDGRIDNIRFQLKQDKAIDFLVQKAKVKEVDQLTKPLGANAPAPNEVAASAAAVAAHGEAGHVHGPDCNH